MSDWQSEWQSGYTSKGVNIFSIETFSVTQTVNWMILGKQKTVISEFVRYCVTEGQTLS